MKLIKYNAQQNDPWTEINRFFEGTIPEIFQQNTAGMSPLRRHIPIDVFENAEEHVIRLELPGVEKKDIEMELENAVLSIKAKRSMKREDGESTIELARSVSLSEEVDRDNIEAHLNNGILEIHLPKREQAKARQITIS